MTDRRYRYIRFSVRGILKPLLIIWTLPNTLLGTTFGLLGLLSGGKVQLIRGVVEFHGGWVTRILKVFPNHPMAMTLGHTIVGLDDDCLARARDHEHIHVRQYERWGPFFLPAYLGCSFYLWLRKRDPYMDNPFEIEAYSKTTIGDSHSD